MTNVQIRLFAVSIGKYLGMALIYHSGYQTLRCIYRKVPTYGLNLSQLVSDFSLYRNAPTYDLDLSQLVSDSSL